MKLKIDFFADTGETIYCDSVSNENGLVTFYKHKRNPDMDNPATSAICDRPYLYKIIKQIPAVNIRGILYE